MPAAVAPTKAAHAMDAAPSSSGACSSSNGSGGGGSTSSQALFAQEATAAACSQPAAGMQQDPWPSREDCVYCSCYCEENAWQLASPLVARLQALREATWQLYVVFISNAHKTVREPPLFPGPRGQSRQVAQLSRLPCPNLLAPLPHRRCRCGASGRRCSLTRPLCGTTMCCCWRSVAGSRRWFWT